MPESNIRLASSADLTVLTELDHVVAIEPARILFIEAAIQSQRAWVVEDDNKIVGYGVISHEFFGESFIDLIYIQASRRSAGFGPALISFVEKLAKTDKVFTSTNESNVHMQHVLGKLGYERSGVVYNLDSRDSELIYFKNRQISRSA